MKLAEIAASDFDLAKTLDSGQVFHWEKIDQGFCGTIGDTPIYVEQREDTLRAQVASASLRAVGSTSQRSSRYNKNHGQDAHATKLLIRNYFALDHPLAKICASFPNDASMQAARDYCRGLRIIRQPRWECLATFICSSMKQVAHIRQISRALRRRFGEPRKIKLQRSIHNAQGGSAAPRAMPVYSASPTFVNIEVRARHWTSPSDWRTGRAAETARSTYDHTLYTFPSAEHVAKSSEEQLRECALGYRAKNLLATARLVSSGEANLEAWSTLSDVDLRTKLCALPGVGSKIANCVMLFGYERLRAFPIDVWIERVLKEKYFPRARKVSERRLRTFSEEYFGQYGGYAQQYLFHHARMNKARKHPLGGRRAVGANNKRDTTHSTDSGQARRFPPRARTNRSQFVSALAVR
jgi:N-glycosylase/DNA lyase